MHPDGLLGKSSSRCSDDQAPPLIQKQVFSLCIRIAHCALQTPTVVRNQLNYLLYLQAYFFHAIIVFVKQQSVISVNISSYHISSPTQLLPRDARDAIASKKRK